MHLGPCGKGWLDFAKNVSICHTVDPLWVGTNSWSFISTIAFMMQNHSISPQVPLCYPASGNHQAPWMPGAGSSRQRKREHPGAGPVLVQLGAPTCADDQHLGPVALKRLPCFGHYPGITVGTRQERLNPFSRRTGFSVTTRCSLSPCFFLSARGAVQPGAHWPAYVTSCVSGVNGATTQLCLGNCRYLNFHRKKSPEGKILGTIQFRGVVFNPPHTSKLPYKHLQLH